MLRRSLHVLSLLVGVLGVLAVVVLTSQATQSPAPLVRAEYGPSPRDMVQIREEDGPYVVPNNKTSVPTGLGTREFGAASLIVNGREQVITTGSPLSGETSVNSQPLGFTALAGSIVEAHAIPGPYGVTKGRAWGYLSATASLAPRIEYGPSPQDMMQIQEGAPFVVPNGKLFVLTALGTSSDYPYGEACLIVNGQLEVTYQSGGATFDHMAHVQTGFTVPAGATISVVNLVGCKGRVWGYLARQ